MKIPPIFIVLIVAFVVAGGFTGYVLYHDNQEPYRTASQLERDGVMREGTYLFLQKQEEERHQEPSDTPVNIIPLLQLKPLRDTPANRETLHVQVLESLIAYRSISPNAQASLLKAVRPFFAGTDREKVAAMEVVKSYDIKEAKPFIEKLRYDPSPKVRQFANNPQLD